MICNSFLNDDKRYVHRHEGTEKTYQCMFWNNVGTGERCAVVVTEDELSHLITEPVVIDSLTFIGSDADAWNDDELRERVCDKALKIIDENNNG